MALITCPHCGKSVSDSVDACIHCGGSLRERPAVEREFAALPAEEQKNLKEEFDKIFPTVADSNRKLKRLNRNLTIIGVIFILTTLAGFCTFLYPIFLKQWTVVIIGAVVAVVGVIVCLVAYYLACKVDHEQMINTKRFQIWLQREKAVHYSVVLKEQDRKKFERITLD